MKKAISLVLVLLMSLQLTACNANPGAADQTSTPTTEGTTEPTVAQEDPAADEELCVLLIGNSFSCGFPEELNGMLKKTDVKARVYSVYYAGCNVSQHWSWLKVKQANYRLRHYQQYSTYLDNEPVDLEFCLAAENWDVIALQQHFTPAITQTSERAIEQTAEYSKNLFDYLKQNFPKSRLVWYETWTYDVGWEGDGIVVDQEMQNMMQDNIRTASVAIAEENGVPMIPCGGAWKIARNEYDMGEMTRGDLYHDGTTGGGQYLNACVWFEMLTGQSCVGNIWRPADYQLAEEKVKLCQQIAHKAVEQNPVELTLFG